jgi:hypothetical protein
LVAVSGTAFFQSLAARLATPPLLSSLGAGIPAPAPRTVSLPRDVLSHAVASDCLPSRLINAADGKHVHIPAHHGSANEETQRAAYRVAPGFRRAELPRQAIKCGVVQGGVLFMAMRRHGVPGIMPLSVRLLHP